MIKITTTKLKAKHAHRKRLDREFDRGGEQASKDPTLRFILECNYVLHLLVTRGKTIRREIEWFLSSPLLRRPWIAVLWIFPTSRSREHAVLDKLTVLRDMYQFRMYSCSWSLHTVQYAAIQYEWSK